MTLTEEQQADFYFLTPEDDPQLQKRSKLCDNPAGGWGKFTKNKDARLTARVSLP